MQIFYFIGNRYCIKNLRKDNAKLHYVVLKDYESDEESDWLSLRVNWQSAFYNKKGIISPRRSSKSDLRRNSEDEKVIRGRISEDYMVIWGGVQKFN